MNFFILIMFESIQQNQQNKNNDHYHAKRRSRYRNHREKGGFSNNKNNESNNSQDQKKSRRNNENQDTNNIPHFKSPYHDNFNHDKFNSDNFNIKISNDNFITNTYENQINEKAQPQENSMPQILKKKFFQSGDDLSNLVWPNDTVIFVDFFAGVRVPVQFIDSKDPALQYNLNKHNQDLAIIDIETKNKKIDLFEICTQNGVLLIHNSGPNEDICKFIKSRKFFTKREYSVKRITEYVKSSENLNIIDIDTEFLMPKRLNNNLNYLSQHYLGTPNYNFRVREYVYSNPFSCIQVLNLAFKSVVEYMIIPIIKSEKTTIGTIPIINHKWRKIKIKPCYRIQYDLIYNHDYIKVTFIPNEEKEQEFINPMIEELFDQKVFIVGSSDGFYGYGTSNGILITEKEISPFKHASIPMSKEIIEKYSDQISNKYDINEKSSKTSQILSLAIKINLNILFMERNEDNYCDPSAVFTHSTIAKPSEFKIFKSTFKSKFNIIPLKINPDLYIHFSKNALKCIKQLQNLGFIIPQAQKFNINEMYECSYNEDFNDQFINNIKNLFNSFQKVDIKEIASNLLTNDIEPDEYKFYNKIVNTSDYNLTCLIT